MKCLRFVLLITAAIAFAGCVKTSNKLVPTTKFRVKEGSREVSGEFPKDYNVGLLEFLRQTNGTTSLTISNLHSKMNPNVIQAASDGQEKAIRAYTEGMERLLDKGIELGKKIAEKAAVP